MNKYSYPFIIITVLILTACGNNEDNQDKESTTIKVKKSDNRVENNVSKAPKSKVTPNNESKSDTKNISVDGATLYQKCAGCHGVKGEKKALGKSDIIAGWSVQKIEDTLKGYKNKTINRYGMGGVMQGQAEKLTNDEIKALADYISKLGAGHKL